MKKAKPAESLAERNAEHVPRYWMLLTPDEAHELAHGRIPDQVQSMATWLDEDKPQDEDLFIYGPPRKGRPG